MTDPLDVSKTLGSVMTIPHSPFIPRLTLPTSKTNPAQWTYEKLAEQIKEFEKGLNREEEVGAIVAAGPGGQFVFHVEDLGYAGPDMIMFYGTNEHGKPLELIQHYTQLNIMLTALPSKEPEPRRIGFHLMERVEK